MRTTSTGQTSPPGSIGQASNGTGPYGHPTPPNHGQNDGANSRRAIIMEEALATHYSFLRAYLARSLKDDNNIPRQNRAKDKLLRLSPIQFHELSTDVYDESQRREDEKYTTGLGGHGNGVPSYLPPKKNFHPKRNSAREKLATLPIDRFRQLATDVLYELERRFPRFTGADVDRIASPTFSVASIPSRTRTPNGSMGGGAIAAMYASGLSQGSYAPPRVDSTSGPPAGLHGIPVNGQINGHGGNENLKPLPKTSQSNTIIPNKSTLVEDDDDQSDGDDDAFGLEHAANGTAAAAQAREVSRPESIWSEGVTDMFLKDKARLEDYEFQMTKIKEKMNNLENEIEDKNEHIQTLEQSHQQMKSVSICLSIFL